MAFRFSSRIAVYGTLLVAALVGAWFAYDHFYGMPSGPSLPEDPPRPTISPEAGALNDRAIDGMSDPDNAVRLLDQAIALEPAYDVAYGNKARILVANRKYKEAEACFDKLTALRPRAAEYYVGHAYCLQRLGRGQEARGRLLYAISAYNLRLKDQPFHARLGRAMVIFLLGKERLAQQEIDEAEKYCPDSDYRRMVSGVREMIRQAPQDDPWAALGLEDSGGPPR